MPTRAVVLSSPWTTHHLLHVFTPRVLVGGFDQTSAECARFAWIWSTRVGDKGTARWAVVVGRGASDVSRSSTRIRCRFAGGRRRGRSGSLSTGDEFERDEDSGEVSERVGVVARPFERGSSPF